MKQKKDKNPSNPDQPLPERLFNGHFIVFTVFALLELPPGATNKIQEAYTEFKRQGSLLLKQRPTSLMKGGNSVTEEVDTTKMKTDKVGKGDKMDEIPKEKILTTSESQRNIGSVTWAVEPKMFIEEAKADHYITDEMWKSIKELTIKHVTESRISVS